MSDCGLMFINEQQWGDVNEASQRWWLNHLSFGPSYALMMNGSKHNQPNIELHNPFYVETITQMFS